MKHPDRNQLTVEDSPGSELKPQSSAHLRSISGVIDDNGLQAHLAGASDEGRGVDDTVAFIPDQNSGEFSGSVSDNGLWVHQTGACESGRGVDTHVAFIPNLDSAEFSESASDNGLWAHLTGVGDKGKEMDDDVAFIRDFDSIESSAGVPDAEISRHLQGGRGDEEQVSSPGLISGDYSSRYSRSVSGEVDENGLWKALVGSDSGVSGDFCVEFIPDIKDED